MNNTTSAAHFATKAPTGPRHIVRMRHRWYSGMKAATICGVSAEVLEAPASTAAGIVQPVLTCKRCAAALGQTVRVVSAP